MPDKETDDDVKEQAEARYLAAAHAMQTGVAFTMDRLPAETSPKHLRVGVNSALVTASAIVHLLIDKGIVTEAEYCSKLADLMEAERDTYAARLRDLTGAEVTLS